ncbi:hypothetical protein SAMN05421863_10311 [Nitrosomonas communis]|uniref:Uncharacterized protein n=1 Tax=Nitrosomonas communis TaxID=44574 RepID=A0A1I4R7P2_9PROT|nr:hypothetical protein SAMN05421863_10311 [Nitrosomonas communis]
MSFHFQIKTGFVGFTLQYYLSCLRLVFAPFIFDLEMEDTPSKNGCQNTIKAKSPISICYMIILRFERSIADRAGLDDCVLAQLWVA